MSSEINAIKAELDKLRERLDVLTADPQVTADVHASLDRFAVAEAIADGIFAGITREKACQFEPDKPCDHCAMCSTRGF
ncbi:MAG: hypothetical protein KF881_00265 [Acidobacteria bacterium]|nr:hypothetical protein [Acidobacteriota bacterium]